MGLINLIIYLKAITMKVFQELTKILVVFMQEMVNINRPLKYGKRNYHLLKQTWKKLGYTMKLVAAILN